MLKDERRNKIVQLVERNRSVSCAELSRQFDVTQETIRRDLEFLDKAGALKKTFGGAISVESESWRRDPSFAERSTSYLAEKRRIAEVAVQRIEENDTIAIDASTTSLQMVSMLPKDKNITVVTNSLAVLNELLGTDGINAVSVGGTLRRESTSLLGYLSGVNMEEFNINKTFMSGNAISVERGLMDPSMEEAAFKKKLIAASEEVILLADNHKFTRLSTYKVCAIDAFDEIITDNKAIDVSELTDTRVTVVS